MMSTETSAAATVRVPKLAVRNRTATSNGSNNASEQPSSSQSSTRTASLRGRGTSDASQRSNPKPRNMETGTPRSSTSQGKQPQAQQQNNSKKKNGVLGFLTLKEPSTSALEQFAEQQKKAAAGKTGRATAVGLSSVSVQKLPEHVPRVNSKWDGLPEDARKKLEHKRKTSMDTGSLFSTTTRQTYRSNNSSSSDNSNSTRRPIGSMSSRPSSMGSTVRGQHKFTVVHPTAKYDTTTPIAVHPDANGEASTSAAGLAGTQDHTTTQTRDFLPPNSPASNSALSPTLAQENPRSAAISVRRVSGAVPSELAGRAIAELPGDGPVELPGDEPPQMAGDEPSVYITTPTGGSPLTPPVDDLPGHTPRVMKRSMVMDAQGTMWYSESDPEETGSDQEVVLPKAFLKRPMMEGIAESPIEYPETPEDWPLPGAALRSLESADSPISPTTNLSLPPHPPPTDPLPPTPASNPPARTLIAPRSIFSTYAPDSQAANRPPSLAPSVASTIDWPLPPSHRLGMAATSSTPRKADVAPWERFDSKADALGNRSSVSTPLPATGAGGSGTKKRFSGILGRR